MSNLRQLGQSPLQVSTVAMGCWPIAGMTSLDVNPRDSRETLKAALDAGINFFDTAFSYGVEGESERLIAETLGHRRDEFVLATKGGLQWDADCKRDFDGSPETIRRHCETSLQRLKTDYVDLLYLHAPDPKLPIEESAAALRQLMDEGKTRTVGASNLNLQQLEDFHAVCPLTAFQPPYNMLQRQIESGSLPWCRERGIAVVIYWPLMKGLLAGQLPRDHVFSPADGRAKYPMFQGDEWQKNQDFLDRLREIAASENRTVAQVVVNWTFHQAGVTSALCGAKRPAQIQETAAAMGWSLSPASLQAIDAALQQRGTPIVRTAV